MIRSGEPAIRVEEVRKRYGSVVALDGLSLTAPAGGVFGLLGPNGAGKTTLVRILTTLLRPDSGRAEVAGLDVVRDAAALRASIGLAGQYAAVDELLTGRENLELVARLYGQRRRPARARAAVLLERFRLADAADRPVRTYSGGMRRRLDLAASLVAAPPVLLLDEPTTGLDPASRLELWDVITDLVQDGRTVLLTTQYLEEADRLADLLVVVDHGRVIAEGTPDALKAQVGGDVLEIHVAPADTRAAAEALLGAGVASPQTRADGAISATVPDGSRSLVAAVRELDAAGVELHDIALRRPSLDEVFLTLTGRSPAPDPGADNVAGRAS